MKQKLYPVNLTERFGYLGKRDNTENTKYCYTRLELTILLTVAVWGGMAVGVMI